MPGSANEQVFRRLGDLLELERELLQSGRASEVASLIEEKMEALQDFENAIRADRISLTPQVELRAAQNIIQMAEENAAHMAAVRNGLRNAIRRVESVGSTAHVGSYGRGGAQLSFTNATGIFNRKA